VLAPPDNFLLVLLEPEEVDYLRLTDGQYRQVCKRGEDGSWESTRVNP
jgi:hypothetical protein